jgi:hypothetical protein
MRLICALICSISFTANLYGQTLSDSLRSNSLRIGIDVLKVGSGIANGNLNSGLEFFGAYNNRKHIFIADLGTANIQKAVNNYQETSKGAYLRLGYEKNLMRRGDDQISFGGRLAGSVFQFQAKDIQLTSADFSSYTVTLPPKNAVLFWLEANMSVRVNVLPYLGLAATARLQRKVGQNFDTDYFPANIPGYGNFANNVAFGFNYYVFFTIPFKQYRIADKDLKPRGAK